jgi:hypothetical protein
MSEKNEPSSVVTTKIYKYIKKTVTTAGLLETNTVGWPMTHKSGFRIESGMMR